MMTARSLTDRAAVDEIAVEGALHEHRSESRSREEGAVGERLRVCSEVREHHLADDPEAPAAVGG